MVLIESNPYSNTYTTHKLCVRFPTKVKRSTLYDKHAWTLHLNTQETFRNTYADIHKIYAHTSIGPGDSYLVHRSYSP